MYSSVADVIAYTGIQYSDLNMDSVSELETYIEARLGDAKSFIDRSRNRDYEEEGTVPDGINNIAMRIVSNMLAISVLRRDTPIIKQEDYNISITNDNVLTQSIKDDLAYFPPLPRFRIHLYKQTDDEEEES